MQNPEEQSKVLTKEYLANTPSYDYSPLADISIRLGKAAIESYGERGPYFQGEYLSILSATSLGQKDEEIGKSVGRSVSTVSQYRSKTLEALGAENIEDAIRISFYMGLLPDDDSVPDVSQFERPLTEVELNVLQLLAEGNSRESIAGIMRCSKSNVKHVINRVIKVTGANTRLHAIRIGLENGLVDTRASHFEILDRVAQSSARLSSKLLDILPFELQQGVRDELRRTEAATFHQSPTEKLADLLIDHADQLVFYDQAANEIYDDSGATPGAVKVTNLARKPSFKKRLLDRGYSFELKQVLIDASDRSKKTAKLTRVAMIARKIGSELDQEKTSEAVAESKKVVSLLNIPGNELAEIPEVISEEEKRASIEAAIKLVAEVFKANEGIRLSTRKIRAMTGLSKEMMGSVFSRHMALTKALENEGLGFASIVVEPTEEEPSKKAYVSGRLTEEGLRLPEGINKEEFDLFVSEAIRSGRKLARSITNENVKDVEVSSLKFTLTSEAVRRRLLDLGLISDAEFEEGRIGIVGAAALHMLQTSIGQRILAASNNIYTDKLRSVVNEELEQHVKRLKASRR